MGWKPRLDDRVRLHIRPLIRAEVGKSGHALACVEQAHRDWSDPGVSVDHRGTEMTRPPA